MANDGGYTFHLGKKFSHHFAYMDDVCAKLNTTRPALLAAVMRRVFEGQMLEELGKRAMTNSRFINTGGRPHKVLHEALVEDEPKAPPVPRVPPEPMPLHPLQTRKTTSEPLPELRPSYVIARPHPYHVRQAKKTKTELRDELRAAIENTERLNEDQHGAE